MSIAKQIQERMSSTLATSVIVICAVFITAGNVHAGDREQAKRIHDRIAGVPPTSADLVTMTGLVTSGDIAGAVDIAMQNKNFYNVTLKNMITPWTNEERSVFDIEDVGAFNDFTALVIGVVREGYDYRRILYDDLLFVAGGSAPATVTASYSATNNLMYKQLEDSFADLSDNTVLTETTQSGTYTGTSSIPANATAGVMTTRAAARAFFYAGTSRAMLRFTLLNLLCNDMEDLKDITRPNDRVHQDASRSPGGDSSIYLNACIGCHAGMDGMMGAYAYYDWVYDKVADEDGKDGHLEYYDVGEEHDLLVNTDDPAEAIQSRVAPKFVQNYNNFIYGHITQDDSWINYWRNGLNKNVLGWGTLPAGVTLDDKGNSMGSGAKQLGEEMANSRAFAECQVRNVFKTVCHGEPTNAQLTTLTDNFTTTGSYRLKSVFVDSIQQCMGP